MFRAIFFLRSARVGGRWVCGVAGAVWLLSGCQKESGPTQVAGQVVESYSGQPVPNAQVQLTKYSGGGLGSIGGAGGGGFSAQGAPYLTDAQGRFAFTFNAEAAGSYSLRASRLPYYQNAPPELTLSNGRANNDLRVPVYASAWARYVLVDELPKRPGSTYSVYVGGYGPGFRLYHPRDTAIVYPVSANYAYRVIWIVTDEHGQDTRYEKAVLIPPLDTVTVRLPF